MAIRRITEADLDVFWELRLKALRDAPEAFGSTLEETLVRGKSAQLIRLGQSDEHFSLGAFSQERLVGTVGLRREPGLKDRHKALVFGVFVDPDFRGRGVGKALMKELIAHARGLAGLEQLRLAVITTGAAATQLYLSVGFQVYATDPRALKCGGQYWDDQLMLFNL